MGNSYLSITSLITAVISPVYQRDRHGAARASRLPAAEQALLRLNNSFVEITELPASRFRFIGGAIKHYASLRPRNERHELALAALYFLIGAVAVTTWPWRDPAPRLVAGNPNDTDQFAWYFRYDAAADAHFRLPALIDEG